MKLKKGAKRVLIILSIVLVIVIALLCYFKFGKSNKKVEEAKVVSEITDYGYKLKDTKSKAYKDLFKELKEVLEQDEVDEEEYAKIISKMFILDLYTLSDKVAKTDIGGVDFIHSDEHADFIEKAMDTIYKYVESNLYGDRKQKLPTVKEVTVGSIEQVSFDYGKSTDKEAYEVKVTWDYTEDMGYETDATIILVHEDNKLSIVEMD